jgi:hypothetical protein
LKPKYAAKASRVYLHEEVALAVLDMVDGRMDNLIVGIEEARDVLWI